MRTIAVLIPALLLAACSQPAAPPAEPAVDAPPPMEANAAATPAAEPAAAAPAVPEAEAPAEDARARIESLLGDAAQFEKVFNAAVVGGDRAAVVEQVRFPLNISGGKKITGPGEFQRNYEKIITPAVVKAVSGQDFGKVFVNQQGVMIGSGQVWLSGQCLDQACTKIEVKVITIQ
ncbi:hypothetical protein R1V99_12825 [Stenotrophomonas maltophilia]|nr:hypothetical protein [Stenotrophomonas maltophilia]